MMLLLPGAARVGGELGEYTVSNAGRLRRAGRIVGNPLAEMQEEMFQEAATEASSRYAGSRMNFFCWI